MSSWQHVRVHATLSVHVSAHLKRLEEESIAIVREAVAAFERPVLLYSCGKDSGALLHVAVKAFRPAPLPFPILHVDTGWKFREMLAHRDAIAAHYGVRLIVHTNRDGAARGVDPLTSGAALYTQVMKTEALKQVLDANGFDAVLGGARRDEEPSRAKERIFSLRSSGHGWDPRRQRPELWTLFNTRRAPAESFRIFPLSDWTELDVWQYTRAQRIPIVPLYLAAPRPVVRRGGMLIVRDDERLVLARGEKLETLHVRFRSLGCYPLTAAIESRASTLEEVIAEVAAAGTSERAGRLIDHAESASMERKKREGYF
jgi:sulfate adenylyltransferase subunit 2